MTALQSVRAEEHGYLFITITSLPLPGVVILIRDTSMGQIELDLFKKYLHCLFMLMVGRKIND